MKLNFKIILLLVLLVFAGCDSRETSAITGDIHVNISAHSLNDTSIPVQVSDTLRFQIARGAITGGAPIFVTSNNEAIGTTVETFWNVGGLYQFPTESRYLFVTSTSNNDILGGTGAVALFVDGLDENYSIITEVILLNGTAGRNSSQKFFRVNDALIVGAGSTGYNEGDVDITHDGTNILSRIEIMEARDSQSIYTVPANYTLFTGTFTASSGRGSEIRVEAWARPHSTNVFFLSSVTYGYQNTWEFFNYNEFPFPEKTDFEVRVSNSGVGGTAKGAQILEFFQLPNSYLAKLNAAVAIK